MDFSRDPGRLFVLSDFTPASRCISAPATSAAEKDELLPSRKGPFNVSPAALDSTTINYAATIDNRSRPGQQCPSRGMCIARESYTCAVYNTIEPCSLPLRDSEQYFGAIPEVSRPCYYSRHEGRHYPRARKREIAKESQKERERYSGVFYALILLPARK